MSFLFNIIITPLMSEISALKIQKKIDEFWVNLVEDIFFVIL